MVRKIRNPDPMEVPIGPFLKTGFEKETGAWRCQRAVPKARQPDWVTSDSSLYHQTLLQRLLERCKATGCNQIAVCSFEWKICLMQTLTAIAVGKGGYFPTELLYRQRKIWKVIRVMTEPVDVYSIAYLQSIIESI